LRKAGGLVDRYHPRRRGPFRWEELASETLPLAGQIDACGWKERVAIPSMVDAGELPTGVKRNALMRRARGEFAVSVDDDGEQYVELIGGALLAHPGVDCLGIRGEVTHHEK
jgi:hypothetical protein